MFGCIAIFVIELKVGPFKPEYAGKLNFYLSAADDLLRTSWILQRLDCFFARAAANPSSNMPCAMLPNRLEFPPTASPASYRSPCVMRFHRLRICRASLRSCGLSCMSRRASTAGRRLIARENEATMGVAEPRR